MNSKSANYGSLDTFMRPPPRHTVCVQQSEITQTTQNDQTNTHNSKPDANPKFDNQILLPNQFKLQPSDSSFITSPNRVPSPSVPSPADSGISLQSPGSDTSETQKHARDSETCSELLKTEKHASTFRVHRDFEIVNTVKFHFSILKDVKSEKNQVSNSLWSRFWLAGHLRFFSVIVRHKNSNFIRHLFFYLNYLIIFERLRPATYAKINACASPPSDASNLTPNLFRTIQD